MVPLGAAGRRLALVAVALVAASCGMVSTTPPAATPTDFGGLASLLDPAIIVKDVVSGDAGCSDPDLVPAAIGFDATGLDQTTPVRLHLYVFRNHAAWERHRNAVSGCAAAFVTDPASFEQVEESPYVVAGQGPWAPSFEAALRRALELGAGTGG